ncbi:hypothetical protein [Cohnella boryungensis]|uniref:SAF domain-containing protein n=1 Tax=Cohnella boryungensis TaxID=768479 RepID=A0ABV8S8H9_9BACL
MNKIAVGIGSLLLLLLVIPACLHADEAKNETDSLRAVPVVSTSLKQGGVVVREAQALGKHYRKVVEGDLVFVENVNDQTSLSQYRLKGKARPILERKEATAASDFARLTESGLVDPISLKAGMRLSIPYTYDATLEQSSIYLATLVGDGWSIVGRYSDASYIDYYLEKDQALARVIVLERSLKVLYPISGTIPDPWTYVSDG